MLSLLLLYRDTIDVKGQCGENITVDADNETESLTFGGSGDITCQIYYLKLRNLEITGEITSLPDYFVYKLKNLTTVTLPPSLIRIGDHSFEGCTKLSKNKLTDSLQYIGNNAFYNCSNLPALIKLPSSIRQINESAFFGCTQITSLIYDGTNESFSIQMGTAFNTIINFTFTGDVKKIDDYVFYNLTSLENIKLPQNLESIGKHSFENCESLIKIIIPNSVTSVGESCFASCSFLEEVEFPSTLELNSTHFSGCDFFTGVIINGVSDSYSFQSLKSIKTIMDVTIIGSLKVLGNSSLRGLSNIESITLPDSLETISEYALADLPTLQILLIPLSVKTIDETAFEGTENIDGISFIGECDSFNFNVYSTFNAKKLTQVLFHKAKHIGDNVFKDCSSLSRFVFYNYITLLTIGKSAFEGCSQLTTFICPLNVTSIGEGAFKGCKSLKNINIQASQITKIDKEVFLQCSSITSIILPPNLEIIDDHAFETCTSLNLIELPQSVKTIGKGAFLYCTALRYIEIPPLVDIINDDTFRYCYILKDVLIQGNLKSINKNAFDDCNYLDEFFYNGTDVPNVSSTAFLSCERLTSITVSDNYKGDSFGNYPIQYYSKSGKVVINNDNSGFYYIGFIVSTTFAGILLIALILTIVLNKKKNIEVSSKNEISTQLL